MFGWGWRRTKICIGTFFFAKVKRLFFAKYHILFFSILAEKKPQWSLIFYISCLNVQNKALKNVGYMIPNKMVADLISLYLQKKWFSRFNVEWINLTKVSACQNKRLFFIWWNYNDSSNFVYLISSMLACYVISDYKKFSLCSLFT